MSSGKAQWVARVQAFPRGEFVRYFAVSLFALAVDLGLFSILLRFLHLPWAIAATLGFIVGALTAYILSIRLVFSSRALGHVPHVEFLTFTAIGVAGLGVTQLVLWIGIELLHTNPELSKLAAAGFTFLFNFVLRKSILFRGRGVQIIS